MLCCVVLCCALCTVMSMYVCVLIEGDHVTLCAISRLMKRNCLCALAWRGRETLYHRWDIQCVHLGREGLVSHVETGDVKITIEDTRRPVEARGTRLHEKWGAALSRGRAGGRG